MESTILIYCYMSNSTCFITTDIWEKLKKWYWNQKLWTEAEVFLFLTFILNWHWTLWWMSNPKCWRFSLISSVLPLVLDKDKHRKNMNSCDKILLLKTLPSFTKETIALRTRSWTKNFLSSFQNSASMLLLKCFNLSLIAKPGNFYKFYSQ